MNRQPIAQTYRRERRTESNGATVSATSAGLGASSWPLLTARKLPAGAGIGVAMRHQALAMQRTFGNTGVRMIVEKGLTKGDHLSRAPSDSFSHADSPKLGWHNFQGVPDKRPVSASSHLEIPAPKYQVAGSKSYDADKGVWEARVKPIPESIDLKAEFYPLLSWVRPGGKEDPKLLEHEQGHFDIAAILAQRIETGAIRVARSAEWTVRYAATEDEARSRASRAAVAPLDTLVLHGLDVWKYADRRYDGTSRVGTDHGRRAKQQGWWLRWISMGLPTFRVPMRVPKAESE